jgi:hypothetical protein
LGRYGLFFINGHADFYQPEVSLTGEVADMDLAIVSGRGPDVLTNIEGLKPLVRDQDVVLLDIVTEKNLQVLEVKMFEIQIFIHLILHM